MGIERRQSRIWRPRVADVKKNALDDGPGIRSVVFFKGCPLRCIWCQNPEALSNHRELQVTTKHCVACARCVSDCPWDNARPASEAQDRDDCRACGICSGSCPSGARRVVGAELEAEELIAILARDEPFYRRSGGGVTFSGGEPTQHMGFAAAVAAGLASRGIRVLLETCAQFPWEPFEADLLPHLDQIYVDVKLADPEEHRRHTGVDNCLIQANLARLAALDGPLVLPRIPLVPGVTDGHDNLSAIARRLAELGFEQVALLAYNPLWLSKRDALGLEVEYVRDEWMDEGEIERCREPFRSAGLEIVG
jgi:pyruvate formate lyase activating enzyme